MKKNVERVIEIPEGVEVSVADRKVTVKGNGKELVREFDLPNISLVIAGKEIKLSAKNATRRELKMMGTTWAHLNNMIKGIGEDFVYTLEVANVHFPMNVKADGDKIIIKSFLGETTQRTSKVLPNVKVDIKGSQITVTSSDIEAAGQTAANLEKATRLTGRDRRIFQDGIFITEKPGRKI
ncbi:50S ribosomal protein L6 [archaeon]|jgi:large subunit ribosomal protein L6|nr:50S ribosomal protein L6 [archaeon]MBT3578264.1 50S ribosomal protein L6 [archaeon]MBT6819815.1 50S ribosomal protein L6 [archaeon]MBT6956609.1 50S ribosomal protein L6 [archaeon]MBT7025597.1 50S ribosomal protein L6 [archaeon]